jgi:hypothetical protein
MYADVLAKMGVLVNAPLVMISMPLRNLSMPLFEDACGVVFTGE